jgi:transposase InsO family protein
MHQKTLFIADHLRGVHSLSQLCAEYGISRKTGYKWIERFIRCGAAGLEERSRRPHTAPNATDPEVCSAILELRRHHPSWGAKKLLAVLKRRRPGWILPGRSSTCELLKRHGLVKRPRSRRIISHPGKPSSSILYPNQIWCADFKGQFRMGNGRYCYPLTVTDGFSRFLLGCHGLADTSVAGAKPIFQRLFQEYGLPQFIRSDNGVPFATNTLARLSRLSAWWVRLGVMPQLIEPGKPQQNGRHERMHRTLKA